MAAAQDDGATGAVMDIDDAPVAAVTEKRAKHPLEPLDGAEIAAAAEILTETYAASEPLRFERLEIKEPAKDVVASWRPGVALDREVRFVVFRPGRIGVIQGVLSLAQGKVTTATELPEARPMIMLEEFLEIEKVVKSDPAFIAACKRRGVEDMDLVCVDPWSAGNFGVPGEEGRRLSHTFAWVRNRELDNFYAHPIEGLNAVVDVDTLEMLRLDDYYEGKEPLPVPRQESNYEAQFFEDFKPAGKPLDIVQPEGATFTVDGTRLSWLGWDVRVGFNGREGLILHDIGYTEKGRRRPVCHRASLTEMVVPYGSPEHAHHRKNVFDIGEYGLGKLANSLKLGCDCLGAIHYMDAWVNGIDGTPVRIENAICIHEEDFGIGWKHWDFRTERTEIRRQRRLVVSSISTVGNYEYASYWYLYQTGMIEFEMKATGIVNTVACEPGKPAKYGVEVAPGVVGQIHQHLFCARLDMAVDGPANTVVECNAKAPPIGPENPMGNVFFEEQTVLATESAAKRRFDPATMRYWKVVNPSTTNAVGKPTGYKLEPTHTVTPFTDPDGPSGGRAGFIYNHLWVTPFAEDERYPAGEFVNHSAPGLGLPAWTAADRAIENTDIVLWHVFGLHHPVRPEDFPVQNCVTCGFKLLPTGFFDKNPIIDLEPGQNKASCCV